MMENNRNLLHNELQIDANLQSHLKETAMWARLIGIVGLVFSGMLAIVSPFIPQFMDSNPAYQANNDMVVGGIMLTLLYLIMAGIGFMISLFMIRFAKMTRRALDQSDQASLDKGIQNLKFVFRTYGIITVVYLGFIVLAFFITMLVPMFA